MSQTLLVLALCVSAFAGSFLGVVLDDDSVDLERYGEEGLGVRITRVVDESPAEESGMEAGDILILFEQKPVTDQEDLSFYLRKYEPGDQVSLVVLRGGERRNLQVELGQRIKSTSPVIIFPESSHQGFLGVTTQEINANLLEFFGVKQGYGVLVDGVVKGSSAEEYGIRVGDVIVRMKGKNVDSIGRLGRIARSCDPGETVEILLVRERKERKIDVRMGSRDHGEVPHDLEFGPWPEEPMMLGSLHAADWGAGFGMEMAGATLDGVEAGIGPWLSGEEAAEFQESLQEAREELKEARR
ncbi:MAG: PDZ domain-containing protein, partial [Planctomycetes bacterium]|nr:PDZ domain-containing protein [Planctomycetota bacterium]